MSNRVGIWLGVLFWCALLILRLAIGQGLLNDVGPRALLDTIFALSLLGFMLLIAAAWGRRTLHWIGASELKAVELAVFSLPIGLGIIAYGVLLLGLLGYLTATAIVLWLILLTGLSWRELRLILHELSGRLHRVRSTWKTLELWQRLFLFVASVIGILALSQALTPPWDYDGLMYHLQGPRLFLATGRIEVLPDVWQANGPFTVEMLFTIGLALGNDTFAKLLHFTFGILLILATFSAGQRWLKPNGGWCAAAILLGIPILPIVAGMAYADLAWAVYSFLALYALLIWRDQKSTGLLIAAGVCAGFALGSKYLALGGMTVLGLWLAFYSRYDSLRTLLGRVIAFGGVAVLIGAPWYVKNWLLTGNPVYPAYWGGVGWPPERVASLMTYLQSFGTGHQWSDYLLSPINLYVQFAHFRTFPGSVEVPSWAFPLIALYPLARRSRVLDTVAGVTFLQYGIWLLGSEQIRFLLPLFPSLSLLTAGVIIGLIARIKRPILGWGLAIGLVASLILITLISQVMYFTQTKPLSVVIGAESKAVFLQRNLHIYAALEFIRVKLRSTAHTLFLWDSQGYYCELSCWPDTEPSRWIELVHSAETVPKMAARLRALGVTHFLINNENVSFLGAHDPAGQIRKAVDFFFREFQPACAKELYHDQWSAVYEFTCTSE